MSELWMAVRLELFKARRLRLLWAILCLSVVILALTAGVSYQAYRDIQQFARAEVRQAAGDQRQMQAVRHEMMAVALRTNLVLPSAYGGISSVLYFPGFVLMTIAAASVVGGEFGWGTVQRLVGRGRRRPVLVAAKLGVVGVMAAVAVLVGLLSGSAMAALTSRLLDVFTAEVWQRPQVWQALGAVAARLWAVLTVYGIVAAAAAFVFRTTGIAVGGALVYYFVDALLSGLIVQPRGWLAQIRPYFLGNVANSLVTVHNPFVEAATGIEQAGAMAMPGALDPMGAWLVLLGYGGAFTLMSLVAFARRDLPV